MNVQLCTGMRWFGPANAEDRVGAFWMNPEASCFTWESGK